VLSPEICVERKSVADLIQSLGSGRLFHQAETMLRHYKRPALLIEFDEGKPFALQGPGDLGSDISPQSVTSKLSLLIIHFPKLRLLWSRSAAHTVSIFQALKANQAEPDVAIAAIVGYSPHRAPWVQCCVPVAPPCQTDGSLCHSCAIRTSQSNNQRLTEQSLL